MIGAILLLAALPFLDSDYFVAPQYRPISVFMFTLFVLDVVLLG